jgi:hypothetical protein
MSMSVPCLYDNEANTQALALVNVSNEECQKGIAPVSLPLLSHFALRGPQTGAIYSPSFNARSVSMANIVSGSSGNASMRDTVYASGGDPGFLGFDATEMGVVLFSVHHFDERATSYNDLLEKCLAVNGQPLSSLTKAAIGMENGGVDHFHLYSCSSCAVPVTTDGFNALRRFLGFSTTLDRPPKLTDLQSVLASFAGTYLSTVDAYKKFCWERGIPFPLGELEGQEDVTVDHATMCRAFSAFLRMHVNVFVSCWEGNHRFYSCATFREGWKPSLSVPAVLEDRKTGEDIPPGSRLNVDVSVRIAVPPIGKEQCFDVAFIRTLRSLSSSTLRASNTVIRPTFKSFSDTWMDAFRDGIDRASLRYLDVQAYLHENYGTGSHKPDKYVKYRSQVINAVVKTAVRNDPFLEQAFRSFKGTAVTARNLKAVLLNDFGSNYQDTIVLTKTNRPYPVAVQVFAHLLLFVAITEQNMASIERYMEACSFDVEQDDPPIDMHDVQWIRKNVIGPSIVASFYLRDEIARGPGWKKMRRANSKSLRSCIKKVLMLIHSNFVVSVLDALSKYGPNAAIDEEAHPLLAEAVR